LWLMLVVTAPSESVELTDGINACRNEMQDGVFSDNPQDVYLMRRAQAYLVAKVGVNRRPELSFSTALFLDSDYR